MKQPMEETNQLQLIVKESGLEITKAQYILDKFSDYFRIAADWEVKAKTIVVVDENNKAEMQMARVGRLFLRDKRIAIEKARVELKEQALREGKAIDGISNVLKALIIPIEEYLEKQERFVEIKALELSEQKRIENEIKIEKERLAAEEAERKEQERVRLENIKLKEEAEVREKKMLEEREKAEAERRALEEKAHKERELAEEKLRKEREEAQRLAQIAQEEADELLEAEREKARIEKEKADSILLVEQEKVDKARIAQERIQKLLDEQIECPFCHEKFNI